MVDLSIIIVSWNVRDLLRCALASLPGATGTRTWETFVIDNASSDGSAAMVRSEFPHVTLIENTENLGFTRANNQGIALSSGRYVLLLNPDTEVQRSTLDMMAGYLDAHPDIGVLGPQLIFADNSVQSSRRRFPDLKTMFVESTVLQPRFANSSILKRYYVLDKPHSVVQDVDWVVGACMLVRREAIDRAGLFDERFFMYSEETDWCLRIKRLGWRVVYFPPAQVVHLEGRSSGQTGAAQHIYFQSSKVLYAGKHFGRPQALALRIFLLATYVYQILLESLKWLLGNKRRLRSQRVALYRTVLRSGLQAPGTNATPAPTARALP